MKLIIATVLLTATLGSQAFAGSLLGGNGGSGSLITVSPQISLLNNSDTSILSGILSRNSILNGSSVLSGNRDNGLLGLGILSGNNSDNSYSYGRQRRGGCGCH